MATLSDPEIRDFLTYGTRTANVGYVAGDGRPLVAPVWFTLEEGEIIFNTGKNSAKGRAITRDPRIAVCVDLSAAPYGFVQVQGEASISEDPSELVRTATMIAARYMGPDRAEEVGRRNGVPGELVVRLSPIKVVAALDMTS